MTIFTDDSSELIASVSAKLSASEFEATGSSGLDGDPDFGQLFFSDLSAQNYTLEASIPGFLNYSGIVDVNGQTTEIVVMERE